MLKQHWRFVSNVERVADNLIIIAAFFVTYHFRDSLLSALNSVSFFQTNELRTLAPIEEYFIVLGIALPLYNAILGMLGAYRSMRFSGVWSLFRVMTVSSLCVFMLQGSILYLLKLTLSRSFVGIFCASCGVGLLLERYLVLLLLRYFRAQGKNYRNLLIAGTGKQALKAYAEILKRPEVGINVVGFSALQSDEQLTTRFRVNASSGVETQLNENTQWTSRDSLPARLVATPETFEKALKEYAIDEVLFTDAIPYFPIVQELAQIAAEEGVRVTIAADLFSLEIFQSDISYFGSLPLIHYQPSHAGTLALAGKRVIDLAVSMLLLILLFPAMLVVSLIIKLDSKGPVFFKQERVGLNGRRFVLLKFRSMIVGAEKLLPSLWERNEMQGPVFKLTNDPRVTRVGKILRKYSIDELPQLINVFRGDMSLVGPRPPLPNEVSLYVRKHRRRLSMRPGLTCTWQVSGRNENSDFERWMELDLDYIDNWSLRRDLKLLVKTIPAVLLGSGAR